MAESTTLGTRVPLPRVATPAAATPVRYAALALLVVGGWAVAVGLSQQVTVGDRAHDLALFVHLASLVAGMGAVLTLDWCGLRWLLGHRSLQDVLRLTGDSHQLIWLGLAGLTVSGVFLSPDLSTTWAPVKLGAVLVVALNGVQADALRQRLLAAGEPGRALLARIAVSGGISQAGWWAAVVIGYLTAR